MIIKMAITLLIASITMPLSAFSADESRQRSIIPRVALIDRAVITSRDLGIQTNNDEGEGADSSIIQRERDFENSEGEYASKEDNNALIHTTREASVVRGNDRDFRNIQGLHDEPGDRLVNANQHYNLGVSHNNAGRNEEAIEAYKQAIEIDPNHAEAHYNLALSYLMTGNRTSALEEYRLLNKLDPLMADKLYRKAEDMSSFNDDTLTLQVGAYKIIENANKLVEALKTDYMNAYVQKIRGLHRVRIRGVDSLEEANEIIGEINRKFGLNPIVIKTESSS